jgi:diguanylate cyclase (GGDEF)-like protein
MADPPNVPSSAERAPAPDQRAIVLLEPTTPVSARQSVAVLAAGSVAAIAAVLVALALAHDAGSLGWWTALVPLVVLTVLDRTALRLPGQSDSPIVISLADFGFVVLAVAWHPLPVVAALGVARIVRICRVRPISIVRMAVEVGAVVVGGGVLAAGLMAGERLLGDGAWERPAMGGLAAASWLLGAGVRMILLDRYRMLLGPHDRRPVAPLDVADALPYLSIPALHVLAGVVHEAAGDWALLVMAPVVLLLGYTAGSTEAVGILASRQRYLQELVRTVAAAATPEEAASGVAMATNAHFRAAGTALLVWPDGPGGAAVVVGGRRGGVDRLGMLLQRAALGSDVVAGPEIEPLGHVLGVAMYGGDHAAIAPVRNGATTVGVLVCLAPATREWNREEVDLVSAAADQLSLALRVDWVRRLYAEASSASKTDPLTGLANRGGLDAALAVGGRWTVLLIDLDDFKPVNDKHGHAAGDEVLEAVALRLRRVVQSGDVVARIGGDEFVVAIRGDAVTGLPERIRTTIMAPIRLASGQTVRVGASVGVATGEDAEHVLEAADKAMYVIKAQKDSAGRR